MQSAEDETTIKRFQMSVIKIVHGIALPSTPKWAIIAFSYGRINVTSFNVRHPFAEIYVHYSHRQARYCPCEARTKLGSHFTTSQLLLLCDATSNDGLRGAIWTRWYKQITWFKLRWICQNLLGFHRHSAHVIWGLLAVSTHISYSYKQTWNAKSQL